jgi:hypothetical protein
VVDLGAAHGLLDQTLKRHPSVRRPVTFISDGRFTFPAHICRERVGNGGAVQPGIQGTGASAHQHGEGRAEHAYPHQRSRDARAGWHPHDRRRYGWITDERPHPTKLRLADEGFHAPLDLIDGAARVYDPIVRGELGEDLHGCFLKDYSPSNW